MAGPPSADPYVGPQPFRRADSGRFFGRAEAVDELLSLVLASRVVVFYAQSGAGKSSLVNAGLRPLLEKDGFEILPTARVQGGLPAGLTTAQLGNPYVYFTLASWGVPAPGAVADEAMSAALDSMPRSADQYGDPAYRMMIFDQFEELFTAFPPCWSERARFMAELVRCVEHDERLRILLIVREDYLADALSSAEAFPVSLRSSMRLPLLGKSEAVEAIECPLRGTGFCYAEGVAAQLVEDLSKVRAEMSPGEVRDMPGDSVEPVQLQVVCTELWRALPPGTTVITAEHVSSYGDATDALAHYYDQAVRGTAREVRIDSVFLRRWISAELVTPANTRGTAYRGVLLTAGLPNPAVDALENHHLIRAEPRAGAHWYELTHDRFLRPIEIANTRAIRRGMIGYLGAVIAALTISLLFLNMWSYGVSDVLLQFVITLILAVGLIQVIWVLLRRRLKYWLPYEKRSRRSLAATVTRKASILFLFLCLWLALLVTALTWLVTQCNNTGPITTLSDGASSSRACLQTSSWALDWGFLAVSALLAAMVTPIGSRLTRRHAIRKWRQMMDRRTGAGVPGSAAAGETAGPATGSLPSVGNDRSPSDGPVRAGRDRPVA